LDKHRNLTDIWPELKTIFKTKTDITKVEDVELIIEWVEEALGEMAQINYPYPVGNLPGWPVNEACKAIADAKIDPQEILTYFKALRAAAEVYYGPDKEIEFDYTV
jgi:hypothetical protein